MSLMRKARVVNDGSFWKKDNGSFAGSKKHLTFPCALHNGIKIRFRALAARHPRRSLFTLLVYRTFHYSHKRSISISEH